MAFWIAAFAVGIALLLICGKLLFPADRSRAGKLMKTYRHLTPAQLEAVPDEEVIEAVVSNLLAVCEERRCDPYALIPGLARERCAVYSIWLLQKELDTDPTHLRRSEQFGFSELAADALEWLSFPEAAEAVRSYLQNADDASLAVLREAFTAGEVQTRLITMIREMPAVFCGEENADNLQIRD